MKMIDGTLKFITFDNKSIDYIDQFHDNQNYTYTIKDLYREKKCERNYIVHKIESSKKSEKSNMALEIAYHIYLIIS